LQEGNKESDKNPVEAKLKWFNCPNGFGFLIPENNEDIDAFVHITTLQKAEIESLGDGARFLCYIDQCPKGAIVTEILELLDPGEDPKEIPKKNMNQEDIEKLETFEMEGEIKWFCTDKGFGFVTADDGEKDIFVHQSCLDRCKVNEINTGMRVRMDVQLVNKGREAVNIKEL
jgi:CspA family cold shock protein